MNESVQQTDDKKELEDFLANEENKTNALNLAKDYYNYMGEKWFTLSRAATKTKLDKMVTFQKLKLLQAFNLCSIKKSDGSDGRQRGELLFKLHFTKQDELKALNDVIFQLEHELEQLKIKRLSLTSSIEKL